MLALWGLLHAALLLRELARAPPGKAFPPLLVPDVNRAPAHRLLLLPRVGPVRARAIVAERARHGPFRDIEDLQRVHGIGPVTVAGLRGAARAGAAREGAP